MFKINDKEIKNFDDLKEIVEKDVSILREFKLESMESMKIIRMN
jgi:hypothetical protein